MEIRINNMEAKTTDVAGTAAIYQDAIGAEQTARQEDKARFDNLEQGLKTMQASIQQLTQLQTKNNTAASTSPSQDFRQRRQKSPRVANGLAHQIQSADRLLECHTVASSSGERDISGESCASTSAVDRKLSLKNVKERRPAHPTEPKDALQLQAIITLFDNNTKDEHITEQEKLQEMRYYLDGPAITIISAQAYRKDGTDNLARALSQIQSMYGHATNAPYELYKKLANGKVVRGDKIDEVNKFFAELEEAHCFADGADILKKFMTPDRLQELVVLRVPFLIDAYTTLLQNSITTKPTSFSTTSWPWYWDTSRNYA